jgi:hypothetical protein
MKPLVSVIMAVFDEPEDWLKLSIESILKQTFTSFEFIIILDCHTNYKAKEIINNYSLKDSRIKFFTNESNIGLAKSLNKALKIASGELIARMDADDISIENRIETQYRFLKKNKNIDLVGSWVIKINNKGEKIGLRKVGKDIIKLRRIINYTSIAIHPTWMFRKSILKKLYGYRFFPRSQDRDFMFRLIENGYQISNIQKPLLFKRVIMDSFSDNNIYSRLYSLKLSKYIDQLHNERIHKLQEDYSENKIKEIKEDVNKMKKISFYMFKYSYKIFLNCKYNWDRGNYFFSFFLLVLSMCLSKLQFFFVMRKFRSILFVHLNHLKSSMVNLEKIF